MKKVLLLLVVIIGLFTSCEQEPCQDCYTYTYSDGSTEWMCVEYECPPTY